LLAQFHRAKTLQVNSSTAATGWSYTMGVHDTCGKPEIITVALREETALFLVNEAARRLREGVDLNEGADRRG